MSAKGWTYDRATRVYVSRWGTVHRAGRCWVLRPLGAIMRSGYHTLQAAQQDAPLECSRVAVRRAKNAGYMELYGGHRYQIPVESTPGTDGMSAATDGVLIHKDDARVRFG